MVSQVEDNLAMAHFETGRYAEALEAGRQLVAMRPAYVLFQRGLGISRPSCSRADPDPAQVCLECGREVEYP